MTAPNSRKTGAGGGSGRAASSGSQTLERGLDVLALIAENPGELTATDLAARLGAHRAVVYRIVRSLVSHGLVARRDGGRYDPGVGLVALAARVVPRLRSIAAPELQALANDAGATATLSVREGQEIVTVAMAVPEGVDFHVGSYLGMRRHIDVGASGLAVLATERPREGERAQIAEARRRGYVATENELQAGAVAVAAALELGPVAGQASVAVISFGPLDQGTVGPRVARAAATIAAALQRAGARSVTG